MKDIFAGIVFLTVLFGGACLTGCDRAAFEKENPVTAEVIEKGVDILEDVAEAKAEDLLNLPANTLNFEIVVFPKGKEHHDVEI